MKRVLILGVGNAQVDAVKYCKQAGYEVIGCSYTKKEKGIALLDYFENVDIKDLEGVLDIARKYDVDLVYSIGSDIAIPVAMKVSEILNLPHFVSSKIAELCVNKGELRQMLGENNKANVPFAVYTSLESAVLHERFPAMMKPVDSQGQRGCFRVNNKDDIVAYFDRSISHSFERKVIIEDYIDGREVSVNAYMRKGATQAMFISDRYIYDEYPGGIIKKHVIPSELCEDAIERIISAANDIISILGISDGPCYLQMKVTEKGQVYLIEASPRLDGCHIWKLIRHCYGVDLLDVTMRDLIESQTINTASRKHDINRYALEFLSRKPFSIFYKDDYVGSDIMETCYYYNDGEKVCELNGILEKCGYVIRQVL